MEDDVIERVMAAMKEASYVEGLTFEQERRHIARAVIEAMKPATYEMCMAVGPELERQHVAFEETSEPLYPSALFAVMIDAALAATRGE